MQKGQHNQSWKPSVMHKETANGLDAVETFDRLQLRTRGQLCQVDLWYKDPGSSSSCMNKMTDQLLGYSIGLADHCCQ